MSDHWNSLADLLGTPSIDPPQKKAAPAKKVERETVRTPSEPLIQSTVDAHASATPHSEVDESVSHSAPPQAKPEQPSRLRSSWDTVARLFGVSSSSELTLPPPADSSASMKVEKAIVPDAEDDLFAGFGRKQERHREDESLRKPAELVIPDREPARPAKKKPSSFWDAPKPESNESVSPSSNVSSSHESVEPVARFALDDSGNAPERRGRSRNIRRGRNSEGGPESPRNVADVPDADLNRDRGRTEARNEPVARRNERSEKPSEGNRSDRGERSARSTSRPSQDRAPSGDRALSGDRASSVDRLPSTERPASTDRATSSDRPPRDAERRPRNDGRVARTNDRSSRPEKRSTESDAAQPERSGERSARSDRPTRDNETQDRPSRGRSPRRELQPVEDDGEWDSREVGFEESDELESELEVPAKSNEDNDSTTAPTRGKRRRRRGGRPTGAETNKQASADDDSGRQAYGRSAATDDADEDQDEVENLRIHKVTSWLDAISPMIDSNMENHKKNPGGDRNRGGGGSRRRNSGGSGQR